MFALSQNIKDGVATHKDRKDTIKKFYKTSNIFSVEFVDYFLKLSKDKNSARYGGKIKRSYTENFINKILVEFNKEKNSIKLG